MSPVFPPRPCARLATLVTVALLGLPGCSLDGGLDVSLSKRDAFAERRFSLGQRVPDVAEASAIGGIDGRVARGSRAFARFVRCDDPDIVFKDEEGTGADRMMTPRLRDRLHRLALLVHREWPDLSLRVTEAWDDGGEHGSGSIHYEGRAADVTTSDVDARKLGRLARLALDAGFDWVFYENTAHVHVSVARD
ncbi:MAG TPA: D-Ala-D-Ala carboxypeptidase family metallohydrolase [Polyangiaceae bacterium]|nr:D-Ala-D-Ala carboxypeptidase family metallohydrolase [Polyangiaceae bacterium]